MFPSLRFELSACCRTVAKLLVLLREQLTRTLDDDIVPLGRRGAQGIMFQVTLSSYGYAVIPCIAGVQKFVARAQRVGTSIS